MWNVDVLFDCDPCIFWGDKLEHNNSKVISNFDFAFSCFCKSIPINVWNDHFCIFPHTHTQTSMHGKTSCCWKEPRLPPISCLAAQPPNQPPALRPSSHSCRPGWDQGLGADNWDAERVNQTPRAAVSWGLTLETGGWHCGLGAYIGIWGPFASLRGVLEPTKTVVPKESISCTPVVANKALSTRPISKRGETKWTKKHFVVKVLLWPWTQKEACRIYVFNADYIYIVDCRL